MFGVRQETFDAYLADIRKEAARALDQYGMLVIPGAEITQNRLRGRMNSHIIALDIKQYISADQTADAILREIRRQGALSIACHPHHRTTRRVEISTCYLWDHRKELSGLVDVWEAANRDDLFSVTSLKHYPYVANSDFHKAEAPLLVEDPAALRKELAGDQRTRCGAMSTSPSRSIVTAHGPRKSAASEALQTRDVSVIGV